MTSPPQSSVSIKRSGTPVSVISMTSNWQQHAAQVEQVTAGSAICIWGMLVIGAQCKASGLCVCERPDGRQCANCRATQCNNGKIIPQSSARPMKVGTVP